VWTLPVFGEIEKKFRNFSIPKCKVDSVKQVQYEQALIVKQQIIECRKNKCRK
jgi:hypothetical protein